MKDFTAELEQVFGVAPSRETGLLIDTFDGAGIGFGGETRDTFTRVGSSGETRTTHTRTDVAAFSICIAPFGDPSVSPCRVANTGVCRVVVPA